MQERPAKLELSFERTIAASPAEVYDAWLDPGVAGTPWHKAARLVIDPKVDGLFWLLVLAGYPHPHYGRFVELERPNRIRHTWMSPNTLGEETMVTVTFQEKGSETLMVLVHSGFPDTPQGQEHEAGWNYFLDTFVNQVGLASRK